MASQHSQHHSHKRTPSEHSAHGHSHPHQHFHHHSGKKAPSAIWKAIAVTLLFMGVEAVGGWLANSLALLSDAAHMFADVGAMLLSLFAIWVARRPSTHTMSFGYHRAEIIGALFSGLSIWFISGLLVYEAVLRMSSPPDVKGPLVFGVAAIGLIANLAAMRALESARAENINVRAAYLHVISDVLGSIGAMVAGLILWFTGWKPIDPIITIVFSALMLLSSWGLVRDSIAVLMESTPRHIDSRKIRKRLTELTGVQEAHDLHIWSVSSGRLALSVHLVSERNESTLLKEANHLLEEEFEILHTTIQVEHPKHFSSERCYDCLPKDGS